MNDYTSTPTSASKKTEVRRFASEKLAEIDCLGLTQDKDAFMKFMATLTQELLGVEPKKIQMTNDKLLDPLQVRSVASKQITEFKVDDSLRVRSAASLDRIKQLRLDLENLNAPSYIELQYGDANQNQKLPSSRESHYSNPPIEEIEPKSISSVGEKGADMFRDHTAVTSSAPNRNSFAPTALTERDITQPLTNDAQIDEHIIRPTHAQSNEDSMSRDIASRRNFIPEVDIEEYSDDVIDSQSDTDDILESNSELDKLEEDEDDKSINLKIIQKFNLLPPIESSTSDKKNEDGFEAFKTLPFFDDKATQYFPSALHKEDDLNSRNFLKSNFNNRSGSSNDKLNVKAILAAFESRPCRPSVETPRSSLVSAAFQQNVPTKVEVKEADLSGLSIKKLQQLVGHY